MKSFPIPAISNFANLVVYPSKQKVSHYFILDMIKQLKFREKAPFTCSVITVCLILRLLRSLFKLSFWRTMSTACSLPSVVILVLSPCTLQCLASSKICSFIFLLARYEFCRYKGIEHDFLITKVGVDGSLSLEVRVDQNFDKLKVIYYWYLEEFTHVLI